MTPEEQTIIDRAASKQAAIKATVAAHKPKSRYIISVVATFLDAAGNDPASLKEYAETYLKQCGIDVIECSVIETEVFP
jgi:hypothetical protein